MPKLSCLVPALMALAAFSGRSNADSIGSLTATLNGVGPNQNQISADTVLISYTYTQGNVTQAYSNLDVYAGQLQWNTSSSTSPVPANSAFATYCIDITHDIFLNNTYNFSVDNNLSDAASIGTGTYSYGPGTASKLQAIENLWQDFYNPTASGDAAGAFQIDIWTILYGGPNFKLDYSDSPSGLETLVNSQLSQVNTELANQNFDSVTGLYALLSTDGGQDQALYQAVSLPSHLSLAGFALLGGYAIFSLRRKGNSESNMSMLGAS